MCQGKPASEPQNLHEKFCAATHGVPCKAVHALGALFQLILGRTPKTDCCHGPGQKSGCNCDPDRS